MTPGRIPRDPRDGDVVIGYRVAGPTIEEVRYTYHLEHPMRGMQDVICAWVEEYRIILRMPHPAIRGDRPDTPTQPTEWYQRGHEIHTSALHREPDLKTLIEAVDSARTSLKAKREDRMREVARVGG